MIALNEHLGGREMNLAQIELRCGSYDVESAKLEEQIGALETDLEAVKQKHIKGLKRQAAVVANLEAELHSAVERSPALFVKPRTITVHGVKVGFTFSNGKLVWDCEDATVVDLIKQEFGRSAGAYLITEEKPRKDMLKTLEPEKLKKIACRIDGEGDVVIVKRVAGDVEKLINKLIEKLVEAMVEE
jgi:hypothetical protein